jgi:GntR family transcriptional regulator
VVAEALGLDVGATVVSRHQQRLIDGTPWSLQTTFYAMRFVEAGAIRLIQAEDIREGVVGYLGTQLGIKQVGYSDEFLVRAPDADETAFFKLPDDGRVAVVEIRRSGFSESGEPLRLTISVFPADRNRFKYNIGDFPEEAPEQAGDQDAEAETVPSSRGS